jgi:tetratricopeptide (TPR) repeat protein
MLKITHLLWKALSLFVFWFVVSPAFAFRCPEHVAYYHFLVAQEALRQGDFAQSAKELKKVLACDRKALFPRKELLKLYGQLRRYQEAVEEAQKILKQTPRDSETRLILAKLYMAQGRPARAIQTLESLLEDDPSFEEALSFLTMIYLREKKLDQAIATLERLVQKNPGISGL